MLSGFPLTHDGRWCHDQAFVARKATAPGKKKILIASRRAAAALLTRGDEVESQRESYRENNSQRDDAHTFATACDGRRVCVCACVCVGDELAAGTVVLLTTLSSIA